MKIPVQRHVIADIIHGLLHRTANEQHLPGSGFSWSVGQHVARSVKIGSGQKPQLPSNFHG